MSATHLLCIVFDVPTNRNNIAGPGTFTVKTSTVLADELLLHFKRSMGEAIRHSFLRKLTLVERKQAEQEQSHFGECQ